MSVDLGIVATEVAVNTVEIGELATDVAGVEAATDGLVGISVSCGDVPGLPETRVHLQIAATGIDSLVAMLTYDDVEALIELLEEAIGVEPVPMVLN